MKRFRILLLLLVLLLPASCRKDDGWLAPKEIPGQAGNDNGGEPPGQAGGEGQEQAGLDPVDPQTLPVRTGLPVMYINTENSRTINDKTTWIPATVRIDGVAPWRGLGEMACEVRGRGNSTWNWSKKPYSLKLSEKVQMLGMPAQKHWVLLANYMDRTLMRDALGFHIGEQTSLEWTPRCVYVELILNGRHRGNYLVAEQVRPDANRVDIPKGTAGTWLFESDFHFDERWQWRERNIPFCVKYPDTEDMTGTLLSQAQAYIKEKLNACWSSSYSTADAALDLQSFADYWIVFEVMGNHELRNPGSVFTHVSQNGKWVAGPVWDFDWGGLSYKTSPTARTELIDRNGVWYAGLHSIPAYRKLVAERWKVLKPLIEQSTEFIEQTRALLRESDKLNRAMWDPAGAGNINGDEQLSFDDAVTRLKTILLERVKVMDSIIADGEF